MRGLNRPLHQAHHAVTSQLRLEALDLITRGHMYDLGLELSPRLPAPAPEYSLPFRLLNYRTPEDMRRDEKHNDVTFHIDGVQGTLHQSTHLDAVVHCQYRGKIFGGRDMTDARRDSGWTEHGVETVEPVVTRGVLLDIAEIHDSERMPDGYVVTPSDIAKCLGAHGLVLQGGDVPLLRTGKVRQVLKNDPAFEDGSPGLSPQAARYLADAGVSVVAIDAPTIDPVPLPDKDAPAHVVLLVERGIPIIENIVLEELAERHVVEFVFVAVPLKITGASGSWIRPLAIV